MACSASPAWPAGALRRYTRSFASGSGALMKAARNRTALVVFLFLLIAGFAQQHRFTLAARAQTPSAHHGIELDHIDRSVKPGDDFYRYCNGAWLQKTEIPNDRAVVSVWSSLEDLADERTAAIIQEAAKSNGAAGTDAQKIADLYHSYVNEAEIEKLGITPVKPQLDAFAAIKDKKDLARALGQSLRQDVDPLNNTNFHTMNLFGLWVAPG